MFENIIVKRIKPDKVVWDNPKYIHLINNNNQDPNKDVYSICKGAENYLSKKVRLKPNTSKEVYKLSDNIWKQLITLQLDKCKSEDKELFDLESENTIYLATDNNNLVDVFTSNSEDELNEFEERLNKYMLDVTTSERTKKFFTDGKDDTIKLVCYSKDANLPEEEYTPVVLLELNTEKSVYKVYTGILIYKTFTFIPSLDPFIDEDKFSRLIWKLDISEALELSTERSEELYNTYKQLLENDLEISAREMLHLLKNVGYKIQLKDDSSIGEIENLNDEAANAEIQNYFNSFSLVTNESAQQIMSLSEIQKVFRYNKITFMEMLKILSKEYLEYEGSKITARILGDLIINVYAKTTDKNQSELIKHEIK